MIHCQKKLRIIIGPLKIHMAQKLYSFLMVFLIKFLPTLLTPPPPIHLFFLEELHQLNATFKKFFIAIQAAKEASITFFIDYGETKTAMLINGNAIAKNINS